MIGLDLRLPTLRWCLLSRRRGAYLARERGCLPIESEAELPSVVEQLLSGIASFRSQLAIALPDDMVIKKTVELPNGMSYAERLEEVKRLARSYSRDVDNMVFDIAKDSVEKKDPDRSQFVWVGVSLERVERQMALLGSWRDRVGVVDIESLCEQRAQSVRLEESFDGEVDWRVCVGLALRRWL